MKLNNVFIEFHFLFIKVLHFPIYSLRACMTPYIDSNTPYSSPQLSSFSSLPAPPCAPLSMASFTFPKEAFLAFILDLDSVLLLDLYPYTVSILTQVIPVWTFSDTWTWLSHDGPSPSLRLSSILHFFADALLKLVLLQFCPSFTPEP